MTTFPNLIAFAGYSGSGKDEAAKALYPLGYVRHNFADLIKQQLDYVVSEYKGFSAFTEDREQKKSIRRTLEAWGEDNYQAIFDEYFAHMPAKAVNTRLVRVQEATEWKRRGGVILLVVMPHLTAATAWEQENLNQLRWAGMLDVIVGNGGTVAELHQGILDGLRGLQR